MSVATIVKAPPRDLLHAPNLRDYAAARTPDFWSRARAELDGLPDGRGLNIAHEAVDRHANGARAGQLAIRWLGKNGAVRDFSYADLGAETSRFANVLSGLGLGKGDLVAGLAGRIPELYIGALGILKNRSVFSPLFSAFGPEPIRTRLEIGNARALLTTELLYERKIAALRPSLPGLEHVILIGENGTETDVPGTHDYRCLMAAAPEHFEIEPTDPEDVALVHFTSGTTGMPKGAVHVHNAIVSHHMTGKLALDLHPQDVFWCTADPGWVTGTSYGIISPLSNGTTMIVDEADFDAQRWYGILEGERVSVWYTAPTAIRMLMKTGVEVARQHAFPALRFLASVGEPLNPEGVVWGEEAFALPFHDNWWQTETGGIMIANFASMNIRPGSMGKPMPGVEAAIVRRHDDGSVEEVTTPGEEGQIALRPGWPSMFRGYLGEHERYEHCFAGGVSVPARGVRPG